MTFNPILATFSFFLFVTGIVLTVLTVDAQQKLSTSCANKKVQNGLNFLLMICVVMMTVPIMQLFCHWGCGCQQKDLPYGWVVMIICVLMIAGSSAVINGLNEDADTCKSSSGNTKGYAIGILSFGVILLFILIVVHFKLWEIFKGKSGGKSFEEIENLPKKVENLPKKVENLPKKVENLPKEVEMTSL